MLKESVSGYKLSDLKQEPLKELAEYSREVVGEGIVLLENDGVLPIRKGERVSVFGRMQKKYLISGTGSGGNVFVSYTTNIMDELHACGEVRINEKLEKIYDRWNADNPVDTSNGSWKTPWYKPEMPLEESDVREAAGESDLALVIIGRSAGEANDSAAVEGSYLLTQEEERMLSLVTSYFGRVAVLLNVGSIIDMKWVKKYRVGGVMYIWQGGQEGGRATVDVLLGKVNPSGKLADTIAVDITDYPSTSNFKRTDECLYEEDIYVGYRYFETFAKDRVLYPFGFGLSYTSFSVEGGITGKDENRIMICACVTNTGNTAGKEVVQLYVSAPQGKLGKSARSLVAFRKTRLLEPGEQEKITFEVPVSSLGSYDESGVTGNASCFVLEKGKYGFYLGNSVRNNEYIGDYEAEELRVLSKHSQLLAPSRPLRVIHPVKTEDGGYAIRYDHAATRKDDQSERAKQSLPEEIKPTADRGFKLIDVKNNKCTLDEFVAQLSDKDLRALSRGEGMNSPKVTGGTGCCYGGVTDSLVKFGVCPVCGTDGPSGIRMDCGQKATAMPIGTLLACSFAPDICRRLYVLEGIEMIAYHIDTLLGPGVNIHRNPLCGRNFEYYSEDPLLSGTIAKAVCEGLAETGVRATIKHMYGNDQETERLKVNAVMSERAAREIYLKSFEITLRALNDRVLVMTSYNPVNGHWSHMNYDLTHALLREEWGYSGFVMTDWWTRQDDLATMIRAENDCFMVCASAETAKDNILESLGNGNLTRAELQRSAKNILRMVMDTYSFDRFVENGCVLEEIKLDNDDPQIIYENESIASDKDFYPKLPAKGKYEVELLYSSDGDPLVQETINIKVSGCNTCSFTLRGTNGEVRTVKRIMNIIRTDPRLTLSYPDGMKIHGFKLRY